MRKWAVPSANNRCACWRGRFLGMLPGLQQGGTEFEAQELGFFLTGNGQKRPLSWQHGMEGWCG